MASVASLDFEKLTVVKLARLTKSRKVSPVEITKAFLERIDKLNPKINAYVTVMERSALQEGIRAEKEIRSGKYRGALHGIPVAVKDNIAVKGAPTTEGSKILKDWVPGYDATVITRLREAGAIILGKLNMHEWAMGATTINPWFGTTRNPWDLNRIPGGSSGGSSAAVAASLCMASLGTDWAGSVRAPSAFCGVVGLKPTFGRVSRYGSVEVSGGWSSDHIGLITKTVEDAALLLQCVSGYDPLDGSSSNAPVPNYLKSFRQDVRGLKIGIVNQYFYDVISSEVNRAVDEASSVLESLGMEIKRVSIPHINYVPVAEWCIVRAEASVFYEPYLRTKPRDFSPHALRRLLIGRLISAQDYLQAQRLRRLLSDEFDEALKKVDVILAPSQPIPAPLIEECQRGIIEIDDEKVPLSSAAAPLTRCFIPFNVTGQPAISLPCGFSAGLPIGFQIAGKAFDEATVLRVAHAYQTATEWHECRPRL